MRSKQFWSSQLADMPQRGRHSLGSGIGTGFCLDLPLATMPLSTMKEIQYFLSGLPREILDRFYYLQRYDAKEKSFTLAIGYLNLNLPYISDRFAAFPECVRSSIVRARTDWESSSPRVSSLLKHPSNVDIVVAMHHPTIVPQVRFCITTIDNGGYYWVSKSSLKSSLIGCNAGIRYRLLNGKWCGCCERIDKTTKLCARCREVAYCGRSCQKRHWRQHRLNCKTIYSPVAIYFSRTKHFASILMQ